MKQNRIRRRMSVWLKAADAVTALIGLLLYAAVGVAYILIRDYLAESGSRLWIGIYFLFAAILTFFLTIVCLYLVAGKIGSDDTFSPQVGRYLRICAVCGLVSAAAMLAKFITMLALSTLTIFVGALFLIEVLVGLIFAAVMESFSRLIRNRCTLTEVSHE